MRIMITHPNLKIYEKDMFLFQPFNRKPLIYFDSNKTLKSKLFHCLAYKTLPKEYIAIRRNKIFYKLFNGFFQTKLLVPEKDTFLVYKGYDSFIFFVYDNNKNIVIYRKNKESFVREKFLGYPIHYDFSLGKIQNLQQLTVFLKNYWNRLSKYEINLHGDFTHNNILIDKHSSINLIDYKPVSANAPIITDHFYFFSYFMISVNVSEPKMKSLFENQLRLIYKEIFSDESSEILTSIKRLDSEDFRYSKDKGVFDFWKNKFYDFIDEII